MADVFRSVLFFFFMDSSAPEFYTLSLHDALPIFDCPSHLGCLPRIRGSRDWLGAMRFQRCFQDRKSTRLNSSHEWISYAVFCLKKKILRRDGKAGAGDATHHSATHGAIGLLPQNL